MAAIDIEGGGGAPRKFEQREKEGMWVSEEAEGVTPPAYMDVPNPAEVSNSRGFWQHIYIVVI